MNHILDWSAVALSPVLLLAVGLSVILGVASFWKWHQKQQLHHSPLTKDMLRSPGQSLRAKIADLDIDITGYILMVMVTPLLVYSIHISQSYLVGVPDSTWRIVSSALLVVACWVFVTRRLFRVLEDRKTAVLGLEGELATGEELDQLMLDGCRVFHDVPMRWGNIDHVVVSHSGVYSVNTKSYGKPKEGADKANAVVDHTTNVIQLPDREIPIPTEQLQTEAKWLAQYLTSAVGQAVDAEPMLALPGWFVKRQGHGSVYVFNPVKPQKFFLQSRQVLSPQLVQQIAHQLEQLCRNVEPSFREDPAWNKSE